jgi:hypothetical protein
MHRQSWTSVRSSLHHRRVPKTQTHLAPVSSRAPALRQLIPGISLGFCFLGHPTPPWLTVGYLLQLDLREPQWVSPFRASIFRDLRTILCAVSLISSGCHVRIHYVAEWGQVPFWACRLPISAISRSAGCHSRRLRTFVENPVHSHLLGASPLSASSLSPSCPCTPTFDDQSPAVG